MYARKAFVCLIKVLSVAIVTETVATAQVALTISAAPPAAGTTLTSNAAAGATVFEPVQWLDNTTLTDQVQLGQSFTIPVGNDWTVNSITVRVASVGTAAVSQAFTLQLWTVATAAATAGTALLDSEPGAFPAVLTPGYWTFTYTAPVTLTNGATYGFMLGFSAGANVQEFINLVESRAAADPYPTGQVLYAYGNPPAFAARAVPDVEFRDLDFTIQGTQTPPGAGVNLGNNANVVGAANPLLDLGLVTNQAVGGVAIDPNGVLQNAALDALGELSKLRLQSMQQIPAPLGQKVPLRKVSLRGLEAAILESSRTGKRLPDAVKFLAGLQRIRYVFVYPEQQDIVLVGPAEGWTVDAHGSVVGESTGRPVMQLDDLLVALRCARKAAFGGISCSIDPTPEGLSRLRSHVSTLKTMGNPQTTMAGIEEALGLQQISVTGVPASSHFARVLVAADYRMKRIAMAFEPAPVRGLPSFLAMMTAGSGRGMSNMLPRWWLQPKYEPLLRDGDGLAWELRGAGVKTMTEEDYITATGGKEHTGNANPTAQKWADLMTAKYDELAVAEPIFGELQNCMDLAIVAALFVKEALAEKAGFGLPVLMNSGGLKTAEFDPPKTVESKASVLKKRQSWVISASGGVLVNAWAIVEKTRQDDAPARIRATAAPKTAANTVASWWWN
jgi:hypothetical protein